MKHTIDLKKYQLRTDLAIDILEEEDIKSHTKQIGDIKITNIYLDEKKSKIYNKKIGNYVTIEFEDVTDFNNRKKITEIFSGELENLLKKNKIKKESSALIVGLGNRNSTPDSLGPLVIKDVLVTNHLYLLDAIEDGFRKTYAINPGVTGETGIETSEYLLAIVEKIKPDFIIVIDALASGSIERVNKTIQMTDTGIHPGSGVGNSRKEISKEILNIPVIAIGVPTVVDAVTIVSDTINYLYKHISYLKSKPLNKLVPTTNINYLKYDTNLELKEKKELFGVIGDLDYEKTKQLIFEVLTPIGYNLMVTPKEIDFVIKNISMTISDGINKSLHEKVN